MNGKQIATQLEETRRDTHRLLTPVDDERLTTQHDPLLSPLVWDYAHIGVFEELWLLQNLSSGQRVDEDLLHTYNAVENPRHTRRRLELMDRPRTLAYLADVRTRALNLMEELDRDDERDPNHGLLRDGFVYDLVNQHERQHQETICQTLQLLPGGYLKELPPTPPGRRADHDMVDVPAGRYPIGTDAYEPYDNEKPRHEVALEAFRIDRFPVTNGEYLRFMEDGGYTRQELWSPSGWDWVMTFGIQGPEYWSNRDGGWTADRFGVTEPVPQEEPVVHVCYFEADAYARWAGKRLPTEFEWEVAATWDPATGSRRRFPWGEGTSNGDRANLGTWRFHPAPAGAYPEGASPLGCEQMLGDVWEWTSSDFQPYPGFRAFPYEEYSEPFFGTGFKVLRGGSWATHPSVARATFRNWDSPIKRPIFAGLRCAADA
ncbi:MAG: ergothioneine biosynthesis protein EgtB [Candidatus Dormibacteraeota bacterium]|nr:ergothioneine biosynthesis protein EgtB [Candidatus Dormibacteraeota bacterium]